MMMENVASKSNLALKVRLSQNEFMKSSIFHVKHQPDLNETLIIHTFCLLSLIFEPLYLLKLGQNLTLILNC